MPTPSPADVPDQGVSERITGPLCFIIFFSVLNGMMFNIAIPDIAAEYGLLPSQVSWVMTAYILVFGLGSLVYGRLADQVPVRRLITIGLVLLNAGSILGFFAGAYSLLIAARVLQAAGGAAIPALAMLVATRYMRPDIRGRVLGTIASTVAAAAAVGPFLGGFAAGTLGWRYLFLIICASALAMPALRRLLPGGTAGTLQFDLPGTAILGTAITLLLLAVARTSPLYLLCGTAAALLFLVHTRRAGQPLIPPLLFSAARYRTTVMVTIIAVGSVFGMFFMVPLMLSDLNDLGVMKIGLTLFPPATAAALAGPVGGRLIDRKGSSSVVMLGILFTMTGYLLLSTFAGEEPVLIALLLIVPYIGFSFIQSSLPHRAAASLPEDLTGVGMGTYNLIFFLSGAFTAAFIGRVLDRPPAAVCLNPLATCPGGRPYSNLFLGLAVAAGAALFLYRRTFGWSDRK